MRATRIIAGLLATLLAAWVWHGPAGRGEALVSSLEQQVRAKVAEAGVPGIRASLGRDPLSRNVTLSGVANDIQREAMGSARGINDHVREVEGIGRLAWADERPAARAALPLLAETMGLAALAYFIGVALGVLLRRRLLRRGRNPYA
jgi:hypothetical protein